jgi:uncharacterized protein (TIGR02217 family)
VIGTGDGTTTEFLLVRTYGGSDGSGTEPIGMVLTDGAHPFVIYLGGVVQDPAAYAVVSTTPGKQSVQFNAAPDDGATIAVDMNFYYFVRFKNDTYDFEKFMDRLWSQRMVTLISLRPVLPVAVTPPQYDD